MSKPLDRSLARVRAYRAAATFLTDCVQVSDGMDAEECEHLAHRLNDKADKLEQEAHQALKDAGYERDQ